ncbi:protein nipsnap isoform X2 [Lycorma delicatula]|uniref:protein nipsnap isoform X2 n=1 Tax=Lycorma delicatula TaxID=130591 RepID=UPI003F515AF3
MTVRFVKMFTLYSSKYFKCSRQAIRLVSTTRVSNDASESWLSKLLVRKIEPTKESHSRMLSDKEVIYELQTHNVQPSAADKYIKNYEELVNLMQHHNKDTNCDLVASWNVHVGDLDQSLHLWRYTGGFASIDKSKKLLILDKNYKSLVAEQGKYLRSRHVQYLLAFSYWPSIESRSGGNIYEIRSYSLKPGTMIEWGNNWARAINYRRNNNEAFAGFFSQVGRLYNVHHIWCIYLQISVRSNCAHINMHVCLFCVGLYHIFVQNCVHNNNLSRIKKQNVFTS